MVYSLEAEPGEINLSADAFRRWAKQYYHCRLSLQRYEQSDDFSPVPYFLLCLAIELQFKAIHLDKVLQLDVKKDFSHDLLKSYEHLPDDYKRLSSEQISLLQKASDIYKARGFQYINVHHAAYGFSNFPDLNALDAMAALIIGM